MSHTTRSDGENGSARELLFARYDSTIDKCEPFSTNVSEHGHDILWNSRQTPTTITVPQWMAQERDGRNSDEHDYSTYIFSLLQNQIKIFNLQNI